MRSNLGARHLAMPFPPILSCRVDPEISGNRARYHIWAGGLHPSFSPACVQLHRTLNIFPQDAEDLLPIFTQHMRSHRATSPQARVRPCLQQIQDTRIGDGVTKRPDPRMLNRLSRTRSVVGRRWRPDPPCRPRQGRDHENLLR